MKVDISYRNALTQVVSITIKLSVDNTLKLQLPSWRPGRYEIANYAQYLYSMQAENGSIEKKSKDCWSINGNGEVLVKYDFYAARMDAGSSWLDNDQLYLNFINCIPYIIGREHEPVIVSLSLPKDYQIACALPQSKHILKASNYWELADSPMIASNKLKTFAYKVGQTDFYIDIMGDWEPDEAKLIAHFSAFSKTQMDCFRGFPNNSYRFLIQALSYRHYHGVEHKNSTVITLGPKEEMNDWKLYKELLGVSSHELYHSWNVTRIRPKEMLPYDFSKEAYHVTGCVTEGVTTYYGDLYLCRSKVFSISDYIAELNTLLKRHFQNEGRNKNAIADSSFDLWLDGYKMGVPGRKVSIYVKGALCALLLDLKILSASSGKSSLDDVMRLMWERYGAVGVGYSLQDYIDCVKEYFLEAHVYSQDYIFGTRSLDEELNEFLAKVGLSLTIKFPEDIFASEFGLMIKKGDNGINKVIGIDSNSEAVNHFMIGDQVNEVEQLNGESVFEIFRNGQIIEVRLKPKTGLYSYYEIIENNQKSESQEFLFDQWLHVQS